MSRRGSGLAARWSAGTSTTVGAVAVPQQFEVTSRHLWVAAVQGSLPARAPGRPGRSARLCSGDGLPRTPRSRCCQSNSTFTMDFPGAALVAKVLPRGAARILPRISFPRALRSEGVSRGYSSRCGRLVASPVELALLAGYGAFLCQCSKTAEHLAETGTSASLVRGRASTDEGRADAVGRCRARQRQAPVQAANATEKGEKPPTIRAQNIIELPNCLIKSTSGLRPNH